LKFTATAASRSFGKRCTIASTSREPPPPHSFITVKVGALA
jgi:hypothetical protein